MTDFLLATLPVLTFLSGFTLLALAAIELVNPAFRFWPPPEDQPGKKMVFMALFRVLVYGLVISSVIHLWQTGLKLSAPANLLAVFLIICGFAIAFAATLALGWSNAFGSKEGLRTAGIFRYSRNPIYVATWFGLAGWALLVPLPFVVATLVAWALLYLVAIFIEERWLSQKYGEPFLAYRRNVRRFF